MENTIFTSQSNLLFARGKVFGNSVIELPEEWEDRINPKTITVLITPCGSNQNISVKVVTSKEIRLQSNSSLPIECYYHVYAETK
jgi:hypothetical protein